MGGGSKREEETPRTRTPTEARRGEEMVLCLSASHSTSTSTSTCAAFRISTCPLSGPHRSTGAQPSKKMWARNDQATAHSEPRVAAFRPVLLPCCSLIQDSEPTAHFGGALHSTGSGTTYAGEYQPSPPPRPFPPASSVALSLRAPISAWSISLVPSSAPTPSRSDAGCLFDRMPESVVPGGEDRIGALPDDLLRRVLSFLTSCESVCTCVLARRWRHLWKSVPVVRVMAPVPFDREVEGELWFVNALLLLRDRAPLHEVDIRTYLHEPSAPLNVELWLRYAASCHVRVLRVWVRRIYSRRLQLPNMTLICQHLTVLDFAGMKFEERTMNFSSCPALEVLEMYDSKISAEKILCKSLRHLTMEMCRFGLYDRTRISCPSLAALKLVDNLVWTPSLESMPLLVTALVRFDEEWYEREECYDHCLNGGYYGDCGDELCPSCLYQGDDCVLLEGLCDATNLKLTSAPQAVCFHVHCLLGLIAIWSCTFVFINRNILGRQLMGIACMLPIRI